MKSKWTMAAAILLAAFLGLAGCEGDDGKDGAPGEQGEQGEPGEPGEQGPPGDSVVTLPFESCAVCHSEGSFASAPAAHAIDAQELVTGATAAVSGPDLVIDFTLEVDGVPTAGYDTITRFLRSGGLGTAAENVTAATLTDLGGGDYTITIADGASVVANTRYLFRVRIGEDSSTQVYGSVDFPASPFAPAVVSAESCTNCHGPEGIDVHGGYFAAEDGAEPCFVCHGASDYRGLGPVPTLVEAAHKYHNGIWEDDGEFVEVTYPTYMTNCSVCHDSDATLAAANAMPVTGEGCFTCHGSMAGFDFTGLEFHLNIPDPETANCQQCHAPVANGGVARFAVAQFHNGLSTGNAGLIFNGEDVSVTEGEKFSWTIDGVVDDGTNLAISWTATYNNVAVDPCNATVGANAPVFHVPGGGSGGGFSMLRSYAQGDDFILGQNTGTPGQPQAVNLSATNTTCTGLVATTIIPVEDVDAEVGRVALQGKPGVVSPFDATALLRVRVPTPTFDWLLGSDDPAPARRAIVDTGECLKCHVGSLYQHGGNRVDNVDMCILCHNSASNEQSVRFGMGVEPSEAYDGKVGETFEMKTMLHRIHSAGDAEVAGSATSPLYVIYRNRGIYAWAPNETFLPATYGTGEPCTTTSGGAGTRVFGSDPTVGASCQPHNFHSPTYPRSLNHCAACHTADFAVIPDQTEAMATTVEAGSTEWINKLDDTLQGAATTACITCHSGGPTRGHAYQNSWVPQEFPEGRQTIIDAVR